jgi:hypothetical protein
MKRLSINKAETPEQMNERFREVNPTVTTGVRRVVNPATGAVTFQSIEAAGNTLGNIKFYLNSKGELIAEAV